MVDLDLPGQKFDRLTGSTVDKEISRLEGLYKANLDKAGVSIFATRAVLDGPHSVRLEAQGRTVTAAKILIATGGWPTLGESAGAAIEGLENAITSNEVFNLREQPRQRGLCITLPTP